MVLTTGETERRAQLKRKRELQDFLNSPEGRVWRVTQKKAPGAEKVVVEVSPSRRTSDGQRVNDGSVSFELSREELKNPETVHLLARHYGRDRPEGSLAVRAAMLPRRL